jgi:hypothetical protein
VYGYLAGNAKMGEILRLSKACAFKGDLLDI